MSRSAAILVFMKYPKAGSVKTRLAEVVGADRAAELYREWIGVILKKISPLRDSGISIVAYITGGEKDQFAEWSPLIDEFLPQPQGDLADRLRFGFQTMHEKHDIVFAIGTDCLEIEPRHFHDAIARLESHDVVFGPARDGGYYLVGSSRHLPDLFDNVRWSTEHALADQLRQCSANQWSVTLLEVLSDIDTWDDLEKLRSANLL